MDFKGRLWLISSLGCWILCASTAMAQRLDKPTKSRESHIPIPAINGAGQDPAALLDQILNDANENSFAKKLAEEVAKHPESYKATLEALKQAFPNEFKDATEGKLPRNLDANDPALQETIRQFVQKNKDLVKGNERSIGDKLRELQSDPEKLKELQKQIAPLVRPANEDSSSEGPDGQPGHPPMPPFGKNRHADAGMAKPPDAMPDKPPSSSPRMPPEGEPGSEASNSLTQRALDFAKKVGNRVENMVGENVDIPRLFAGMKMSSETGDPSWFEKKLGVTGEALDRLGNRLAPERWLARMERLLPEGTNVPSVSLGGLRGGLANAADASTEAAQSEKGWSLILIFAALAVGLLGIWKGTSWYRQREALARESRTQLGPWPVEPSRVRTATDIIKAFEYLSVLHLGRVARMWNHREIAKSFSHTKAGADAEHMHAAEALASIYEQARYAPWAESLPESDLCQARRHLSLLAGAQSP
ncbi:MAG: hypothetical protein ACJ8FY_23075 [Gemmataceae bacterium]